MEIHRSFKIPLKARRPSEDCQYTLPADSREAKEIEYAIKRQTWDINDLDRAVSISLIKKVDNPSLEKEYREKKSQLREEGRSTKELSQQLAFCLETDDSRVKEICQIGLECCGTDHTLGDGGMGVTVWRCPDLCIRAFSWPASGSAFLLVFKIVKGRVKPVTPRVSPGTPNLEPTPNHDCHISRNTVSSSVTDLTTLLRNTQYYLYEYDDEGLPSKRPRHCLPFAVVPLKRNEMASPRSPKRPLAFIEIPVSPAKQLTKHAEELKAPSFADDDGILVWRGLVTSGNRSLGRVSLLAGHKLGVNFWKSYLDVSRKIPLRQLGLMLPGDVKNGWKWPLLYRNCALSVCTVKQAQGEACEALKSFTRHLVTKAKSAGVLCIDSITTMFLLPSGKLAIHLGFCETEMPPRLFCIVCRRHASPLMLKSACGYSTFRPYSSTTVNNEATAIDPSSFNFKTRYTSKIIVSSTENSRRLDPKLTPPRQTLKRSLSFSYSPAKVAKKGLQRVVRSASSSVGVSSKEETPIRPAILPILEVSCDGSRRKDNCVWENSCAWDNKSQIAAGSSHISFNSLADGEKFEEGNSYMDSEKTIILEGSTKNLLTLKTSPTVSKNATLSYLQSEERSCQSLQLSEEQVTCNTSPNLEADELASSTDYPLLSPHSRQIWVKTRESLSKPSLVEVTLQESTYAQSGPQSATAVLRDGDLSLRSTNANDWALQSSRLASTPSSLAQPTVQASIQKSSYKENEHRFSVTDESESETSLRSDSQAHLPVRWSGVTETSSKVPGGSDRNFCVREMTASSSSNRKHCNVAESSTSRSELVFECPRGKMKESGVIPLCGENVSSSCSRESHDHPQLIFPGQNCIPFLWCGSDDSPSQKEDTVASRKGFLVHPGMNGSCSGLSNVSADKKTFFCVDVEKDLEGPLDKLEVQSSCLRGDGLNPIPPANVPQENYNSEMYDSLEIVDMEISDSSTDLNNEDALHNLKVAADLSENFPLCTDGDLHDNLETVDMEMSKTSNFETLHLNDGVFLNSTSIEASLTEIPCTGCEDKRERVNVEISDLTPDQTVSSQPYSYVPLTDCYDSPRNHLNGSSKTHDSIGLHKRVNGEEQRLSQTMLASFPRTGLVLNSAFLEPSCLVSSLPSTSRENTFETIGGNATEQTKSSSMDPSVTTAISTTRESTLESQDVTKPIDMDISDDSEVITVSCEKDNNGGYRLEVFCNLSKKDNSQSQDTNSNTQISAKAWEETVEETAEETAEDTVSLGVTSDHPKFTSQERSSSFSSTSLLREHGTCSSITEELHQAIEHSVPSASASDTQPQNSFPKEQESKCGAVFTYGQVSSFSLSPPKSPKVSVRKLKILQAAFKAETDISGFTSDSRTTPSSPANVVKYISHKSSFHSTVKHCKESCAETSESSDCTGVQNSSGSSAKGCKTPVMSSTAFEKEVTVVPEQKGVCRGGVIEMSLIEDWGFHTSDSDCSERQLTVDGRCQPQTGEGDDLYTLDAHKTFQTSETCPVIEDNDFPEPETVVCSPVAPSEAFNSEFIGESGFRYPSAGDRKTTAAEEETSLTQRFRGDLPELMRSSDVKPATMLSPSKPSPAEEYSENVTAINERDSKESSTIVPQLASDMDSAPDVPKACPTTECSETGGFKIEWSHTEISIGDSLVSDDDVSVAGSSQERTQKYSGASESVNTNRVLKIPVARSGMVVEPRSPEEVQDTILLETLGASYLPVSGTHSSKAEKIGMETVPLSGSTIRFDNLSCTGEGKIMEAEVSSTVAHKNEGCPKLVAQESVISFPGQVNEEILSDGKKDRDSFWELLDEEHATDLAGEEERKNCSLKVPVEEEKLNAEDRAAATETKYAIVDCSVPGKEIAESVNSTQNTEAVMPASLQDIGREDCQEFSDVTTSTAAKGRESHLESRAGKRMFDHVSDDRTMQTARRIEEYADCSRTESRVVSTKAESMAGIRTITSKRRSEVSSESFSTIPQKAKPGERTVEPVLKWDIRCKTEQLSSKTTSGSGKAAKDRKPSDRISKSEKTQTCDEVNSESSSIKDRPCLNSLRRGFAAAEGRILDERTVREGDIKSRKSAEIKTCTSSKRGQSSIDSEGSSIGDTRNSNRYAYSSKRAPPLYSTGTPHAYKELEVRARQEKCTNDDFSAPYRDTRGRTESLKDTNHLQRENMVQYTKKVPWEPDQWAVHKLGRKRQKMTPPPPLISLEREFRHGQDPHQRWGEGEASNGHNHFYPPCCGQPKNLFPRVDYITEQQCSRMVWKHRSYPCWVSPQLSLPPVTNKGRAILHHLIPDYPRWYPEGTFSLNDPRIGQNQFEQVYQGSLVHGKPVCVPSPGRGQSVLAAPPPLIPGLWAMPAIPCHQPYPVYRPR